MIEIKFSGDPETIKSEMAALLSGAAFTTTITTPDGQTGRINVAAEPKTDKPTATRTRRTAEPKQGIQTGDERVGPEDSAADQKQDAADEAADKKPSKELTHDDIRAALGEYVKKFGMPAAQEDGPKVIALALKNDKLSKVSEIPNDQTSLKTVLDGINEMTAKNPFMREAV